jgi:hypothetical protein
MSSRTPHVSTCNPVRVHMPVGPFGADTRTPAPRGWENQAIAGPCWTGVCPWVLHVGLQCGPFVDGGLQPCTRLAMAASRRLPAQHPVLSEQFNARDCRDTHPKPRGFGSHCQAPLLPSNVALPVWSLQCGTRKGSRGTFRAVRQMAAAPPASTSPGGRQCPLRASPTLLSHKTTKQQQNTTYLTTTDPQISRSVGSSTSPRVAT